GAVLENVPGLIVTQHSGEGKANLYFLRAFNLDHGTDLVIEIDDMPITSTPPAGWLTARAALRGVPAGRGQQRSLTRLHDLRFAARLSARHAAVRGRRVQCF